MSGGLLFFAQNARGLVRAERWDSGETSTNGGDGPHTPEADLPRRGGGRFRTPWLLLTLVMAMALAAARGQTPNLLSYQGRVLVSGNAFSGIGQFKFALVSADGSQTYWGSSADANHDGQPDTSVSVPVSGGLFSVFLGDTSLAGMAALAGSVFTNQSVHLRIWFSDGAHGFEQLAPDQVVAPAAYAFMAANVADGAVTVSSLSSNAASALTAPLSTRVDALSAQLSNGVISGSTVSSLDPQDGTLQGEGFRVFATIAAPGWVTSAAANAPSAGIGQAGVWTGQQLLAWGGNLSGGTDSGSGAGYRPDLDRWQTLSSTNAPAARDQHTAVWSGREMLIWGGASGGNFVNTGGRYNPSNDVWMALSTASAPAGRIGHVAAWTGGGMVVWGGRNSIGILGDGGYYDPGTDQWTALTLANPPSPRFGAGAVVTANRVLVWGGQDTSGTVNTGAQLLFNSNGIPSAWLPMSSLNAPSARSGHSMVWTGQKLLVWGGQGNGSFLADGAAYDPVADVWSALNGTNAPVARAAHSAVWSGQEMLVFGGEAFTGTLGDGGAYDPAAGKWRALSGAGGPQARSSAVVAWSGSELLLFGGVASGTPVSSLQRLIPQPTWYLYRKP